MADAPGSAMPESIDDRDFVIATYLYRAPSDTDIHRAAGALAEMQSTGTWVTLELETQAIRERHAARVLATWEVPEETGGRADRDTRDWVIQIAYPSHNIGAQIPLLLATVYGECASAGEIKLIDLDLPESFVGVVQGPEVRPGGDPRAGRRDRSAAADHDDEAGHRAHPEGERRGLLPGRHRRLGRREG